MGRNRIQGTLPTTIGMLTSLLQLYVFAVPLHPDYSCLALAGNPHRTPFKRLDRTNSLFLTSSFFEFNSLSGTIPSEIGLITQLTALYVPTFPFPLLLSYY